MHHQRSIYAKQRRYLRTIILDCAFVDRQIRETVNQLNGNVVEKIVAAKFTFCFTGLGTLHEQGEVLLNSRGQGSFDQLCNR